MSHKQDAQSINIGYTQSLEINNIAILGKHVVLVSLTVRITKGMSQCTQNIIIKTKI